MLLILASDQPSKIDFQSMFMKLKSHWNFHVFIYIKILTLALTYFLLYWNFIVSSLRVYPRLYFGFLFSSLSLSLGCGSHLSDKMITWMTSQEISLFWISWESSTRMRRWWWGIYTPEPLLEFSYGITEFDPEFRTLTMTFPNWWPLLRPLLSIFSFLLLFIIIF
jgi:hypothetical protein